MNEYAYERKLGWNWLWFLPLCVAVLFLVEGHTIPFAWQLFKLAHKRWSWAALISPSAYFCLIVIVASVFWPLQALALIADTVKSDNPRGRWLRAVVFALLIFCVPVITDALLWGSFPFTLGSDGASRLRMIPFIPWPSGKFLAF